MFSLTKLTAVSLLLSAVAAHASINNDAALAAVAKQEEQTLKARIGIAVIDTATGSVARYRGDERFPLNSTHKALLCGALLNQQDKGKLKLSERTQFDRAALVTWSPVTEKSVAPANMSWQQLCHAAIAYSDNTAANLIARKLGGQAAVTRFFADLGDKVTRLDRFEPELNSAIPGDMRDTTTPVAVSETLQKLTLGEALKPASRAQLLQWMRDDRVAGTLLRSVLPAGWSIADKTGAGEYGSRSIISVVWPENGKPLIIAIYVTQTEATLAQSNAAIARIGKAIFAAAR
ncbi:class A beta-lactamase [Pantoea sp. ACRSB]|uniref:class A beta-lactamase n=1 Tax=Pantoea sp. ACRSB TaxID=2918207 RepID=UPI002892E468|nr:class A beta-lactamase [Pantoea sp. ACRSB]MCG7389115.1 class A beta-lactamase [Pantoea sp. ACRSB]